MEFLLLLLLIVGGVAFWAVRLYYQLRTRSEAVKRSQSNLVGELKKRATLANQLIDIAKSYGDHEKLTHLTVASRNTAAADPAQIAVATSRALAGISFVAERFPELKANANFNTLMGQLQTIENDVQKKREALNAEVEQYNGFRASFPAVLIAGQLGFPEAAYSSTDEAGLEAGAAFCTDDGELLRQQFARPGKGMGDATRQIGQVAGAAIGHAQASLAQPAEAQEAATPDVEVTPQPVEGEV
jgi:LemA protein